MIMQQTQRSNTCNYNNSKDNRPKERENIHHKREYPLNTVPPAPGGILGSGGLIPWTEPNHETRALTLKSSTGLRVTTVLQEGHVY